jgi:hypothetical protein
MTGVAGFAQLAASNAKFKMQNANAAREARSRQRAAGSGYCQPPAVSCQPTPAFCILNYCDAVI